MKEAGAEAISSTNGSPVFPPKTSAYSCIQMNGKEVFRFAVRCVPQTIQVSLDEAGLTGSNIDWLLLHQVGVALKYCVLFDNYGFTIPESSTSNREDIIQVLAFNPRKQLSHDK